MHQSLRRAVQITILAIPLLLTACVPAPATTVDHSQHMMTMPAASAMSGELPDNPIPSSDESLAAGAALYEQNCLVCHGPQGRGDGPAGLALNPPPADLSIHTEPGVHPDGQLFLWISEGVAGTAMPAFQDLLAEEERWHLVNYIRSLYQP